MLLVSDPVTLISVLLHLVTSPQFVTLMTILPIVGIIFGAAALIVCFNVARVQLSKAHHKIINNNRK